MKTLRLRSSASDLKSCKFWLSIVAEFLGTFLLVFMGFGSAYNNMNPVKLGLAFGLTGAVVIYCFGPISGAHINPAVSFGLLIAREISLIKFILYSLFQIFGATVGFGMIYGITGKNVLTKSYLQFQMFPQNKTIRINEAIHRVDDWLLKLLCELVITFVLVFTVMRLCVEKTRTSTEKGLAPLVIGLSITVGVYCGMNISGGSMNPAASLGKYIFAGSAHSVWTHIIGPLLGGGVAGLLYQLLFTSQLSTSHIRSYLLESDFENFPNSQRYAEPKDNEQLTDKL